MSGTGPLERKVTNSGWFRVPVVKELKTWMDHPHHHLPPCRRPRHLPHLHLHPVVIRNLMMMTTFGTDLTLDTAADS